MMDFKDKTIILAVPNHFGLPEVFQKNLEFLGFKVFLVQHDNRKIKLSLRQSAIHFFRKNFKKNKTFKAKLTAHKKENPQLAFLEKIEKVDYSLVIRPDLFSDNVLALIKKKANLSTAFQWDGMSRFPLVKKRVQYFDKFFVFDKDDTFSFPETIHINNFYFDHLIENIKIEQEVFFVGTFMKDRINDLVKLAKIFQEIGLKTNINIVFCREKQIEKYANSSINFRKKEMTFEEGIKNSKASSIILDFQNSFHKGLSFRTFEAIGYQKKLITNNPLVKNYDFFNENNIFVINNNLSELKEFIEKKHVPLSIEIVEKYSFTTWINSILSI